MTDELDKLADVFGIIPASRLIGPYTYRARLFKCDNCGTGFFPRGHENWCIDCLDAAIREMKSIRVPKEKPND